MATYSYQARILNSKKKKIGVIEAENLADAVRRLKVEHLVPLKVMEGTNHQGLSIGRKKVPLKERLIFTRQLAVMIKAGLPLIKALEALSRQTSNQYFRSIILKVITEVQGGQPLSVVMAKYPKVFSDVYIAVIKAGEQTGQLAEVLFNLADQQEKQADLVGKVRGAMMYPAIILVALIGVVFLIVFFVLPSLKTVFADMGGELPITTRMLFAFSDLVQHYFYIILPIIVGIVIALRIWISNPKGSGRRAFDFIKIKVPVFGQLTTKVYMANFSRTMAMLVKASLPILQSIKIVQKTIDNKHFDAAFERIATLVESGKPFSYAIAQEPLFPSMVSQLATLGEESGNLESVLLEITRFYDTEVDNMTKNMASLIEPIMLIIMGIGVAFIVASVLSPIYKLVDTF